jgi:serine/threonine protein kinase
VISDIICAFTRLSTNNKQVKLVVFLEFIVGCIILALEYIHANNIIHRDLKPENIVFEETGYVRITDFGVARKKREENS